MFDQVVNAGKNKADDEEESEQQGDDEEESEEEDDNFGFGVSANGNQHLQLPPADADEEFVEEDHHMMDVPEDNNQHPEDIIEVSDDVIQDQHIEVA